MEEALHWSHWTARLGQLNRELQSCVAEELWDRIPGIQTEKDQAIAALEHCLPKQINAGTPEWEALSRLATEERSLAGLFGRTKESISGDLGQISATSRLSKRFRASYGTKDPANPNWEHFT